MHWLDYLAEEIDKKIKDKIVISSGWSVSGPIHVGNFRSDGILPAVLGDILRKKGREVENITIAYTQDPFKAKPSQIMFFEDLIRAEKHLGAGEDYSPSEDLAAKYKGTRYVDIPDPYNEEKNWGMQFLKRAVETFPAYGIKSKIITTTEFYKMKKTKDAIKLLFEKKSDVIKILNKYRANNPFPEDWIPINPWCPKCKHIGENEVLDYDLNKWEVILKCVKCGYSGKSDLENGKLNWRLEWPTLWYVLDVNVEPYGKDHATRGGSRDACRELFEGVYKKEPPFGFFTEWIGKIYDKVDMGDMTGSGNILIEPREWLEVAKGEMLRYLYIAHKSTKRFAIDFQNIHLIYEDYDMAEEVYYGEEARTEKKSGDIHRSFELASLEKLSKKKIYTLPFNFAVVLTQILPKKNKVGECVELLKRLGHVKEVNNEEKEKIKDRLEKAETWVRLYGQDKIIHINEVIDVSVKNKINEREINTLKKISSLLDRDWKESELEEKIFEIVKKESNSKDFFKAAYNILISKDYGPRLAGFILAVGREKVKKLFGGL